MLLKRLVVLVRPRRRVGQSQPHRSLGQGPAGSEHRVRSNPVDAPGQVNGAAALAGAELKARRSALLAPFASAQRDVWSGLAEAAEGALGRPREEVVTRADNRGAARVPDPGAEVDEGGRALQRMRVVGEQLVGHIRQRPRALRQCCLQPPGCRLPRESVRWISGRRALRLGESDQPLRVLRELGAPVGVNRSPYRTLDLRHSGCSDQILFG